MMGGRKWKSGQVALADLLSFWCLVCPLFAGIVIGAKMGILGAGIGLITGFVVSIGGFWGFRKMVVLLATRWEKKPSTFEGLAFCIIAFMWLFGFMFLAMGATTLIAHRLNA